MEKIKVFFVLAWASIVAHPAVKFIVKWWDKFWEFVDTPEFLYTFPGLVFLFVWLATDNGVLEGIAIFWAILFLRQCFKMGTEK
jgi:hypothetical protein